MLILELLVISMIANKVTHSIKSCMVSNRINNSIIKTRYTLCKLHLCVSALLYFLVWVLGLGNSFELMLIYGIMSFCLTSVLLKSELRIEGFSLTVLFLAGSYLRLIIPTITDALMAVDGEKFQFKYDFTDAIFPCALAMNMYYMMFLLLMTYFSKTNRVLEFDLTSLLGKKHLLLTTLLLFAWGVFYTLFSESFSIGFLGMFVDGFCPMALVMLAFVSAYNKEKKYTYTFLLLTVIEVLRTVIWGFYKGAIIQPIFILGIYYFLYCRYNGKSVVTLKSVIYLVVALVFMIGFVYPFMNAKRYAAGWDPTNGVTQDIDIKDIVITVFENKDKLADNEQSEALLSRFDAIPTNAYFYKLVQKEGINPIVLFASVRQFWPRWLGRSTEDDVLLKPGYVVNSYLEYGALRKIDRLSSAYIGSFGSGYFWGWWIGAFIVCMFNAYVVSWLLKFCTSHSRYYLSMLVITSIIMQAFQCFEEVHSGGLSRALIWFIYVIVLKAYLILKKNLNV